MTLPQKLQEIRRHHNLSQEEFAEKIGVVRHTVSRWESGQFRPEPDKITVISELFCVSKDYLLNDEVDNSIGKLSDFQCLKIVFWISSALTFSGCIVAICGWGLNALLVTGFLMVLMGCVSFEVCRPRNADKVLVRFARRQFYALNIWGILPAPLSIGLKMFLHSEIEIAAAFAVFGIYVLIAVPVTTYLMYQFHKDG